METNVNTISLKSTPSLRQLEIYSKLQSAVFQQTDTPFNSRMLTYYSKSGLLLFESLNGELRKRRSFNGGQMIWLKMLEGFSELGYPFDYLRIIKMSLEEVKYHDIPKAEMYESLAFFASYIIETKQEYFFIAEYEGSFTFHSNFFVDKLREGSIYFNSPHVSIPFTKIVLDVWRKLTGEKIQTVRPALAILKSVDDKILGLIKKKEYNFIEIVKKDDSRILITGTETVDLKNLEREKRMTSKAQLILHFGDIAGKVERATKRVTTKFNRTGSK